MERILPKIKGRGSAENPANRFEKIEYIQADVGNNEANDAPKTVFYKDHSGTIISYNDSPDVGFEASINPYRGREHGCIYCYARPTHEYLGLSAGLNFETKILVKEDAPELLRRELSSPEWQPNPIAISGVTDPYQPAESHFSLTRACLKVLAECSKPVGIVTKNYLVTRDIDILKELAEQHFPDQRSRILNRVRAIRGGKLYGSIFHERMRGKGIFADQVDKLFEISCRKTGIAGNKIHLSSDAFHRLDTEQLKLF